jgi:GNAT superfamily N-acetyltransferase
MNHLILRKASPNDSVFAYRVKRAAFKEYVEKVWGWEEDEQQQLHVQRFGKHDFRIINSDGIDVGTMAVAVAPDCVNVHQMFLLPEHQGKGIGGECMALILEEARQLGLPVRLQVMKVNPRALAFYERLGFTRTGETDTHDLMEKVP